MVSPSHSVKIAHALMKYGTPGLWYFIPQRNGVSLHYDPSSEPWEKPTWFDFWGIKGGLNYHLWEWNQPFLWEGHHDLSRAWFAFFFVLDEWFYDPYDGGLLSIHDSSWVIMIHQIPSQLTWICLFRDFLLSTMVKHNLSPPFAEYIVPTTEQANLSWS